MFRDRSLAASLRAFATIATFLLASDARPGDAQEPLLWGSLKPGPYAVGFRSLYQFDHTRQYDPEFTTDPNRPPVHHPRPILISMWYPAQKTATPPIEYRRYLDVATDDPKLKTFSERLMRYFHEVICEEVVGKSPATANSAERAALERFLSTKTTAVKNAPVAKGRFPVIIYHPGLGGIPDDNSALFEYLASHGYVVLSSVYHSRDADTVRCGGDMKCSFRDMEFLSRYARELPFVDADQLGAAGHSYGAWVILAWAAEPCSSLRAAVSLDSGMEYGKLEECGYQPLVDHMHENKENIRAATIRFASRERDAQFQHLDPYLKYSLRCEATVSSLKHNDYLTHGAVGPALMPEKWPDPKKSRRTSYDRICEHTLHFLDATLRQDPMAKESLQRSARGEGLDDGFKFAVRSPAPAPPTSWQLAQYVRKHGPEKADEMLRSFPELPSGWLLGAPYALLNDGDAKTALTVLNYLVKNNRDEAEVQAMLGQALAMTGDRTGAIAAYRKAKEMLPSDKTVGNSREIWKYIIERGLKELNAGELKPKTP
jgi:hypothetical protein